MRINEYKLRFSCSEDKLNIRFSDKIFHTIVFIRSYVIMICYSYPMDIKRAFNEIRELDSNISWLLFHGSFQLNLCLKV